MPHYINPYFILVLEVFRVTNCLLYNGKKVNDDRSTPQPRQWLNILKITSAVLGAKQVTQDRVWLSFGFLYNVAIAWD